MDENFRYGNFTRIIIYNRFAIQTFESNNYWHADNTKKRLIFYDFLYRNLTYKRSLRMHAAAVKYSLINVPLKKKAIERWFDLIYLEIGFKLV